MAALAAVATIASTVISAAGTMAAAKQQEQAAKWQQLEYERQAKAETAAAQREGEQQERKKDLALSRLQTVAAASGFSATDPTTLNVGGEIERYGTLQQQMAQYGGTDRAAGLRAQGELGVMAAKARSTQARGQAIGTILGSVGGLAGRYGGTGGSSSSGSYYFG